MSLQCLLPSSIKVVMEPPASSGHLIRTDCDNQASPTVSRVYVHFKESEIPATAQPLKDTRLFIFRSESEGEQERAIDQENPSLPKIFVAKPIRNENEDELWAYEKLKKLQGNVIPQCYGTIKWRDLSTGGGWHSGIAVEYLENFRHLQQTDICEKIYAKCISALDAISAGGVLHGDIRLMNILLDPKTENVCIIDFENSKFEMEAREVDIKCGWEIPSLCEQNRIDLQSVFEM